MKLYEIRQPGGIDSLVAAERADPVPGPGQVLVRIKAAALNYRDLVIAKGAYGRSLKLPLVPLSDGAGVVEKLGDGARRFQVGDRVAPIFMQTWLAGPIQEEHARSALGGAIDGVLAELVALPEDGLVGVPEHLSWEEAATLPCAAVTAWHALVAAGGIKAGDTVLVLGSGGVSVFALQFARLTGATVIATSSSDEKLARLQQLGASHLINYRQTPEWGKTVRELTGGAGVDHIVEVGGAGTFEQSLRAIRTGGTISYIGLLAGKGDFNPNWIFAKAVRIHGIYVGSRAMFEEMNRAIAANRLRPVLDQVFPFEQTRDAFRRLESGAHVGKIVIRV